MSDVDCWTIFFRREPKLLIDILKRTVHRFQDLRSAILNTTMDITEVEKAWQKQCMLLKYGGRIPDMRWKMKFSPILQETVCVRHVLLIVHLMCIACCVR